MSEDIVARLRTYIMPSNNIKQEAADEIERLRAELAGERKQHRKARDTIDNVCVELFDMRNESDTLRAELAAEREDFTAVRRDWEAFTFENKRLTAERDALRADLAKRDALLREAREWLPLKEGIDAELDALIDSIDALLSKGGGNDTSK